MTKLPSIYKTVTIDALGEITKQRWTGTFTVKAVMSNADKFEVERMYSRLLPRDSNPSDERRTAAATIAELSVRVSDGPAWWESTRGGQLMADMEPLYSLMIEIAKVEKEWSDEVDKLADMGQGNVVTQESD